MPKGRPKNALSNLVPDSFVLTINESEIRIAANKHENAILSMISAGQMRALLDEQIKKYRDRDMILQPREMRDLAAAARDIAAFSAEVYGASEGFDGAPKPDEKKVVETNFENIIKDQNEPAETTPVTPSAGPDPVVQGEAAGEPEVLPLHKDS